MTLVDTSVWIDVMRGSQTPQTHKLSALTAQGEVICTCGPVVAEILQGIKTEKSYQQTKADLDALLWVDLDRSSFHLCATIYRELRRQGETIRGTIDCLIAALVVQNQLRLLTNDRDYVKIDRHYPLNLV